MNFKPVYVLHFVLILFSSTCRAQQAKKDTASPAPQEATCFADSDASRSLLTIKCQGMTKEQADRLSPVTNILGIMNKLLENKLDPDWVAAKLQEIQKTGKPPLVGKTYFCDGMWQAGNSKSDNILDTKTGGNDSAFLAMIAQLKSKRYRDLLQTCLYNLALTPDWLTPRLFCGLAYANLNEKEKAETMLSQFEAKSGPSYDDPACHDMTVLLRYLVNRAP